MAQKLFALASVLAFLAIAIGAFGAHGLKNKIEPNMLAVFEVGVRYHFYHAIAIFIVALAVQNWNISPLPAYLFFAGIIIFSGSLYLLALTNIKWLGAITPIGGVLFLLGWGLLAFYTFKKL